MLSANSDSLLPSQSLCLLFLFLCCTGQELCYSEVSEQKSVCCPDLREKTFNFLLLCKLLVVGFLRMPFIRLRKFHLCLVYFEVGFFFFNHEWVLNFVKCFFCSFWEYRINFLCSVNRWIASIDFQRLSQPSIFWIKSFWSFCITFFIYPWILLVGVLYSVFMLMRYIDL